jgi:hypothetical protein
MAEDFDLDRVVNDPAYRRRIIARLNGLSADEGLVELDSTRERTVLQPAEQSSVD